MINFLNDLAEGKKHPIFYLRDYKNGENIKKYILESNWKLLSKHNIFVKIDKNIFLVDDWKKVSLAYKVILFNIKCEVKKEFLVVWINNIRNNVVYDYDWTTKNLLNSENQWINEIKKWLEKRYKIPLSDKKIIVKFLKDKGFYEVKKWIANFVSNSEKDFYKNTQRIKIIKNDNIQLFTASDVNDWIKENIWDTEDVLFSIEINFKTKKAKDE